MTASAQEFKFKSFSFAQGLNAVNIKKTLQDKYGFIWVATQDGLYRFDGLLFDVIKKNGSENAICQNFISDMYYDGKDELYVSSYEGGVDRINVNNLVTTHLLCHKANSSHIDHARWARKMVVDKNKNIWLANPYELIKYNLKNGTVETPLPKKLKSISNEIAFIKQVDSNVIMLAFNNYGLVFWNTTKGIVVGETKNISFSPDNGSIEFVDFATGKSDDYIAINQRIIRGKIINYRWEPVQDFSFKRNYETNVHSLAIDDNQNLYIGTSEGLMLKRNLEESIETISLEEINKFSSNINNVGHLFIDKDQNLWAGTSKTLLLTQLLNKGIKRFTGITSTEMPHLYSIVVSNENTIYTTGTSGLFITDLIKNNTQKIIGSSTVGRVHYMLPIGKHQYFVSTDNGMFLYDSLRRIFSQQELLKSYPEWQPYVKFYFNNSVERADKIYWASEEQEGLIIWNKKQHTITQLKAKTPGARGLLENNIHNIKTDRDGYAWIMCNNAVYKFDLQQDSVVKTIAYSPKHNNGLNSTIVYDMYDDGNYWWFATYGGGLNAYHKKNNSWKYITEANGLCNNSVYAILPQNNQFIWVSTNKGISRVDLLRNTCTNLFVEDGLHSNSFEEKGSLALNGKFYFGGIDGFTEIDPWKINFQTFESQFLSKKIDYFIDNKKTTDYTINKGKIDLPSNTSAVNIYLSTPEFINEAKFKYFYRITNKHSNFLPVGADNLLQLSGVDYGDYIIDIKRMDANNEEKLFEKFLILHIDPKWHQTNAFKLLLILVVAFVLLLLYNFRIKQLKRVFQVRQKISQNLHDDIGSTLSAISLYTQVAKLKDNDNSAINNIDQNTKEVLEKLDDIVWATNPKNDKIKNLVNRMEGFAKPLLNSSNIEFNFTHIDNIDDHKIGEATRQSLFIMFKETLNNVLKHAQCNTCTIRLTQKNKMICYVITDDGIGFDPSQPTQRNGLINLKLRVQELNGKLSISSLPGNGTTISIQLPL